MTTIDKAMAGYTGAKVPDDQPEPGDESRLCGNCQFWKRQGDSAHGSCYVLPPTVRIIVVTSPASSDQRIASAGAQMTTAQQMPASVRPGTDRSDPACRHHRFADEGTDGQEIAAILESFQQQIQGITKYLGVPSGRVVTPGKTS